MIKLSVYVKPCLAANSINALRIKRLTSGQIKGGADWKARGGNKVTVRSGGPGRVGNKIRMRCENSREPGDSFLFAIYSPWRAEGAADFELGCYLRVDCQSRDAPLQSRSLGSRCTGTACTLSANKMWKKRKGKKEYRIYTYIYTPRRHLQRYLALLSFAWRARPGVRFIFPIRLSSLASPDFSRPLAWILLDGPPRERSRLKIRSIPGAGSKQIFLRVRETCREISIREERWRIDWKYRIVHEYTYICRW